MWIGLNLARPDTTSHQGWLCSCFHGLDQIYSVAFEMQIVSTCLLFTRLHCYRLPIANSIAWMCLNSARFEFCSLVFSKFWYAVVVAFRHIDIVLFDLLYDFSKVFTEIVILIIKTNDTYQYTGLDCLITLWLLGAAPPASFLLS